MKKAVLAFVAIGALVAFRPMVSRIADNFRQRVREVATECKQLAGHCREMLRSSEAAVR